MIPNLPAMQETWVSSLGQEDPLEKERVTQLLCGSAGKESACNVGDLGSIPGLGRSPGEGKGYTLQYSGLENSMDCIVDGVAELDTTEQLSLHFTSVFLPGKFHGQRSLAGYSPWDHKNRT